MPQILVVVDSQGQALSVRKVNDFVLGDVPTLLPPFLVGENVVANLLKSSVRNSPHLSEADKSTAIKDLTYLVPLERVEIIVQPDAAVQTPAAVENLRATLFEAVIVPGPLIQRLIDP